MRFVFQIEVELERSEGKFASRDDISEQIMSELEGADPSSLTGENGGEYETTTWEVSDVTDAKVR